MNNKTCRCPSYDFPHRMGSGSCKAVAGAPICSGCNSACSTITIDTGMGKIECWGAVAIDVQESVVSDCCADEVLDPETMGVWR